MGSIMGRHFFAIVIAVATSMPIMTTKTVKEGVRKNAPK